MLYFLSLPRGKMVGSIKDTCFPNAPHMQKELCMVAVDHTESSHLHLDFNVLWGRGAACIHHIRGLLGERGHPHKC